MNTKDDYIEIKLKLEEYENLFDSDPRQALRLMIELYSELHQTSFHDLADSIELWIYENADEELTRYISGRGEKYNSLMTLLRNKF